MGTERPNCWCRNIELATAAFASDTAVRSNLRERQLRNTLLEKRDRFVAEGINKTLGERECGILFLGMLHQAAKYLDTNINVVYPLGLARVAKKRTMNPVHGRILIADDDKYDGPIVGQCDKS